MVEVQSVPGTVAAHITGLAIDLPVYARICMEDGELVGAGGLAFGGGRTWLWFTVNDERAKGHGLLAIKEARKLLKRAVQLGATEVWTPQDENYQTSGRLLKLVGFERTEETVADKVLWAWRHSAQ
jgi:hypothetical protein